MSFWFVLYTQIKARVENGSAPECFMSKLLQETDVGNFSDEESTGLMATLVSAGCETTATALKWFFKACTKYPEFVHAAHEEIDRVVGQDRMPDWADQQNLPYFNALIKELHRWASLAPIAFSHATSANDSYRGYSIPNGTVIMPNTYGAHHSPEFFPEHDKFIPERFLPIDDKRHAPGLARIDYHYDFGVGRRVCPGQHVADASLYIVISRLLWAYDIGPKKGAMIDDKTGMAMRGILIVAYANFSPVGVPPVVGPAPFECSMAARSPQVVEIIKASEANMRQSAMEDAALYEKYLIGIL